MRARRAEAQQQAAAHHQPRAQHRPDHPALAARGGFGEAVQIVGAHDERLLAARGALEVTVHQARQFRCLAHDLGQAPAQLLRKRAQRILLAQDLVQHRPRHRPDVDGGVEQPAHALDVEQGLLQQQQLRLDRQLVAVRDLEQLDQHLAQRDLRQRAGEVRLAHRAHRGLEVVDPDVGRHPAGLDVQHRDPAVVAPEHGVEVRRQVPLVGVRQRAHDAEVQGDEARIVPALRIDPDVAGVGVGMEEVVAEHLLVEQAHALGRELAPVDAGRVERGDVVGRDAVHALEGQHAVARQFPDHLGHLQVVRVGEVAPQQAGVGALALQIELVAQSALDLGHQFQRLDALGVGHVALGEPAQRAQQREVGGDALLDLRPQHLHHHLAAVGELGRMDLRDRGRGQRFALEAGIELRHRLAQRALDLGLRQRAVEGCDAVLQQGELGGDVGRQQVAAGREDLAELDEDRPQFLQRQPQALAARHRGDRGRRARDQPAQRPQRPEQAGGLYKFVEAIAQQHARDRVQAQQAAAHARGPGPGPSFATRAARRSTSSRRWSTSSWKPSSSARAATSPRSSRT